MAKEEMDGVTLGGDMFGRRIVQGVCSEQKATCCSRCSPLDEGFDTFRPQT